MTSTDPPRWRPRDAFRCASTVVVAVAWVFFAVDALQRDEMLWASGYAVGVVWLASSLVREVRHARREAVAASAPAPTGGPW
ncbi:hypothetical protein [Nocardioides sp. ChNu-99]|uniref:hypothetical protein n=1 Tax=Nocardioides sp. ChNu-99 TaxID=2839897 RepID=UPI002404A295|nr:hypothetical protein [Nocardioides sp. ChNu-99]MDF9716322.1 hypothetical protein [Nocardioides sp. ChNu-99]